MATLDWTPNVRAAASGLEQRVFFNLDPGTSALEPIYVEFMYHTNNVRQFDYNSGPRPIQWSGLVTSEAFPMIDHTKTRLLGSDGSSSNILPQGTASIRLSYNNGRYHSYPLEVIDGDIVSVSKNGVIAWEARNRWWLSGRDYSLGMKNGTVVPVESSGPYNSGSQLKTIYYPIGHIPDDIDTRSYGGVCRCRVSPPQTNCCGSTTYVIPPKYDPNCNFHLYAAITQRGGTSRNRL